MAGLVGEDDIVHLIRTFSTLRLAKFRSDAQVICCLLPGVNLHLQTSFQILAIQQKSNILFSRDYHLTRIHNESGTYCTTYPIQLLVPRSKSKDESQTSRCNGRQPELSELFK